MEDFGERVASFFEFEIAGLLVSVYLFEAHEGSHSLLKMFWCMGQCSYSGQYCGWEDQVGTCFFLKASLIGLLMYLEQLEMNLSLSACS